MKKKNIHKNQQSPNKTGKNSTSLTQAQLFILKPELKCPERN